MTTDSNSNTKRQQQAAAAPSRTISNASSSSSSATVVALPSDEALELLLSPDGYYTYLGIPKPDPHRSSMNAANNENSTIDLDQVKKNYRRLSLKHHPDRKGGDEETFRTLNRAKIVLSSPKLRREYDLVGLDLEDEEDDGGGGGVEEENDLTTSKQHHENNNNTMKKNKKKDDDDEASSSDDTNENHHHHHHHNNNNKTETVMSHLASLTLASVLQMVVRTILMGIVSIILSRYTILTMITIAMLIFLSTRIYSAWKNTHTADDEARKKQKMMMMISSCWKDVCVPLMIAVGVFCMFRGRRILMVNDTSTPSSGGGGGIDQVVMGDTSTTTTQDDTKQHATTIEMYYSWTWTFWFGETLVMTLFLANSFENTSTNNTRTPALLGLFTSISAIFTLWLRGQFWRYATLIGFQGVIALLVVLAFPIMEMILEQIVEEKMKKVGEKIRAHDARLRELQRKRDAAASAK
ncbi:hypothetical protein ACHAXM_010928 [Skeletonema potamos]